MTIKEFLELSNITRTVHYGGGLDDDIFQVTRPRIECNDGFSMSVQAGYSLYCNPRVSGSPAYYSVEIGYPSDKEYLIMKYAEDEENLTDTVYGYVPINLVEEVIEKHKGMDDEKMIKILSEWAEKNNRYGIDYKNQLENIRFR